jgi:hypothetical protein
MEHTRRTLSRRPREHDVRQGSDVSEKVDFMPHGRQEAVAMYGQPLGYATATHGLCVSRHGWLRCTPV